MTCNCIGGNPCPCRLPTLKRTDYGYCYYDTQVQTLPEFKLHTQYYGKKVGMYRLTITGQYELFSELEYDDWVVRVAHQNETKERLVTLKEFDDEI